ncbi:hypothetical protein Tco_1124742 [Tanacetum coccineum]|uniref:Uncharacterized protein n=1 Tax=Tanacetum coccineum TaxID=301880 RepID=A0ABQ5J9T4_9ASTR
MVNSMYPDPPCRDLQLLPWPDLELHLSGKLETSYKEVEGVCGGLATKGVFGVKVAYKEVIEVLMDNYIDENYGLLYIATQRSLDDLEAQQNVERVQEHLVDEELEQLLEGNENVDTDAFMVEVLNSQEDPGTRIDPMSDKESLEVKKSVDVLIIHDDE